ncbi:unnamed protein product [Schistocephalus solidus]|uniref:Ig-like domain-containing protein n=1 Tax=Schistocephalus solidus TaxID=70667 RepID=A0A183S9E0_SCHSO|nr:unnamed protein product [Schistocephalus solidus]
MPIVLADRVKQFTVPEWIDVDGYKVEISGLMLRNKCTFTNSSWRTWTVEIRACNKVHYVAIEPPLGETVGVGVTIRCATVEVCDYRFIYTLSVSDVTAELNEGTQIFASNSSPIKITHDMLGKKVITCTTRDAHQRDLRVSQKVVIEGQPFGIQLIRKNNAGTGVESDTNMVNANETLHCASGGYPLPEITWLHVSSPKQHPRHRLAIHRSNLITTVFDPPGYYTYTCHARNSLGEVSLKHTFYLRNANYVALDQQTIVFCWVLVNLAIFACLVWMGQLVVNRDLLESIED